MNRLKLLIFLGASAFLIQCGPKVSNTNPTQETKQEKTKLALAQSAGDSLHTEIDELLTSFHKLYEKEDGQEFKDAEDLTKPKYVKFSDVKSWRPAGEEYAAGYDADGKLLAIYDLTYQNTRSIEFIGRSILGTVGFGDLNLRELIRIIMKAVKQKEMDTELDGSGPMTRSQLNKVNKVLEKMQDRYGDLKSPLAGEWWKDLPIKRDNSGKLLANTNIFFRLSDIDLEEGMSQTQKLDFRRHLKSLQDNISKFFNIDSSTLFDELAFKHNTNGTFNLVLNPTASLAPSEQPDKVVDFIRYQSSFGYAFLYLSIKSALSEVAGAIAHPAAAAAVKYAVHRWFELYEQELSFHRFKAFEHINAAERMEPSPFAFLSDTERVKAGVYVLSHESSLFHVLFQARNEAYYYKSVKTELDNVRANTLWTNKKHINLNPITSLFYYGDNPTTNVTDYMLSMGARPRFFQQAFIALNYNKPLSIRVKRNVVKGINDVLAAISLPYPDADKLMSVLYDVFIMDDVRDELRWEARLVSALHRTEGRDYTKEIELLYGQRVNPFEFNLDEEKVFIQRSKKYLGL